MSLEELLLLLWCIRGSRIFRTEFTTTHYLPVFWSI